MAKKKSQKSKKETIKKEIEKVEEVEETEELDELEEFEEFENFDDDDIEETDEIEEDNDEDSDDEEETIDDIDEDDEDEEKDDIDTSLENDYENLSLEDRIINVEKKTNAIFILVIILTILAIINLAFVLNNSASNETITTDTTEETLGDYDVSEFDEISAADISSLSKKDTIVVYIGRSTCGYCVQYLPILQEVQEKYDYTTKYIDIAKILDFESSTFSVLDQESYDTLINMSTSEDQEGIMDQFGSTPMTLVIKKNKIINSVVGLVDTATLEALLEQSGFGD